jgi:hypothetical protein
MRASAPAAAGAVLLRAGALRLLVPQQEVGAAEYIEGMPAPTPQRGCFEATLPDGGRMVVALSELLRPLDDFPAGRFLLTRLQAPGSELCFAWDEVRVVAETGLERHPLPPALRTAQGPIDGYVQHGGEVLLCTTAQRLLAYAAGD